MQNKIGRFDCLCPRTWNGQQCEVYDPPFPGGVGRKTPWNPTIPDDLQREKIKCAEFRCHEKSGNGICDEACNTLGTKLSLLVLSWLPSWFRLLCLLIQSVDND